MPNIISGQYFSEVAYSFHDSGYTYEQYDCIHFVNLCRTTAGITSLDNGTNTVYRSNRLYWKGDITTCIGRYGAIPQGALLFKIIPEGEPGYDSIPARYYGDGVGNVTHVGIRTYIGLGVMQSGGYGGTGVHDSNYNSNYWTHVGLADEIRYAGIPYPGEPIPPYMYPILFNRKKVLNRVRRRI